MVVITHYQCELSFYKLTQQGGPTRLVIYDKYIRKTCGNDLKNNRTRNK